MLTILAALPALTAATRAEAGSFLDAHISKSAGDVGGEFSEPLSTTPLTTLA